jgi:hypothetical protein
MDMLLDAKIPKFYARQYRSNPKSADGANASSCRNGSLSFATTFSQQGNPFLHMQVLFSRDNEESSSLSARGPIMLRQIH